MVKSAIVGVRINQGNGRGREAEKGTGVAGTYPGVVCSPSQNASDSEF